VPSHFELDVGYYPNHHYAHDREKKDKGQQRPALLSLPLEGRFAGTAIRTATGLTRCRFALDHWAVIHVRTVLPRSTRSEIDALPESALRLFERIALIYFVSCVGHVHAARIDRIYPPELHHHIPLADPGIFLVWSARKFQNNRISDLPRHPERNGRCRL